MNLVDDRIDLFAGYKPRIRVLERGWWRKEGKNFRLNLQLEWELRGWVSALGKRRQ
jgi:hypothetical protein